MRYMIYAEMYTLRVLTSHFVFMVIFFDAVNRKKTRL